MLSFQTFPVRFISRALIWIHGSWYREVTKHLYKWVSQLVCYGQFELKYRIPNYFFIFIQPVQLNNYLMLQQSFSFPSFSSGTMEFVVLSSFSYLFWVILLWKYLLLVSPEKKRKLRNKSDTTVISKLQCILDETNNETIIPIEPKKKPYINLNLVAIWTFIAALP